MAEAGNSLDETIALLTAANTIVQNPNTVGTALKTLSLRIRGVKTELEEAGLETDNMANSTSQLQAKIKALTHGKVDVMVDANTFKNTTEIIREMSKAWEDMTDKERAASLELLGGKRQANVLSAIIQNFDIVENAIETSANSEGSALKENEKVLDSIQGRLNQFNNAVETFWNNLLDSDVIKFFVDLGTQIVKLASAFGEVRTVIFAILMYLNMSKKYPFDLASWILGPNGIKRILSGLKQISNWFKRFQKTKLLGLPAPQDQLGLPAPPTSFVPTGPTSLNPIGPSPLTPIDQPSEDTKTSFFANMIKNAQAAAQNIWTLFINMINKLKTAASGIFTGAFNTVKNKKSKLGYNQGTTQTDISSIFQQAERSNEKLQLGGDIDEINNKIQQLNNMDDAGVVKYIQDINNLGDAASETDKALASYATTTEAGGYSVQGASQYIQQHNAKIKASGIAAKAAAVGHTLLNAALSMGISMIISVGISAITKLINANKELAESVEEAMSEYNNATKTLKNHYDTIEDIKDDYQKLANGVDNLGNNISLSTDEYQRYNEITNKIAEMFPEMVSGYTDEGNAIIALRGNVEALTEAYEKEAQAARDAIIVNSNDIFKNFKNNTTKGNFWAEIWNGQGKSKYDQLKALKVVQEAISQGVTADNYDDYTEQISKIGQSKYGKKFVYGYIDNALRQNDLSVLKVFNDPRFYSAQVNSLINTITAEIEAEASSVRTILNAYLEQNFDYLKLSDKAKNIAQSIISSFNTEFYSQFDSASEMEAWVNTNLIQPLQNAGNIGEFELAFNLQTKFNNNKVTAQEYQDALQKFTDTLKELGFDEEIIQRVSIIFGIEDISTKINSAKELLDDAGDLQVETLTKSELNIIDANKTNWQKEMEVDGRTTLSWEQLKAKIEEARNAAWVATEDFDNVSKSIDSIQDAYSTLSDVVTQYNNNRYLTLDNLQALLSLEPEYLACLQMENGQLSINQSALETLIQSKLDAAKATTIESAITQLNALAARTEADAINESSDAANNATSGLGAYAVALGNVAQDAITAAGAVGAFNAAVKGAQDNKFVDQAEIDAILANMNTQLKLIDSVGANLGKNFNQIVNPNSSKDSKSDKDDAFQKEMDYWENRIAANQAKYEQIQNEIDLLEKRGKKANKEFYEEQIALEEQRLSLLNQQKAAAQKFLGTFKEGSDEWFIKISPLIGKPISATL